MKPVVVGFSGRLASGKTTLSTEVATRLDWPRVSFGDYVRAVARLRGSPDAPVDLQKLGASLIQEMGWRTFCRQVLAQADWAPGQSIVVDGIRHAEALITLRRLVVPAGLLHIHINVNDVSRRMRLDARQASDVDPMRVRREDHSTEVQVSTMLPRLANLVVDGGRPLADVLQMALWWLQDHLSDREG